LSEQSEQHLADGGAMLDGDHLNVPHIGIGHEALPSAPKLYLCDKQNQFLYGNNAECQDCRSRHPAAFSTFIALEVVCLPVLRLTKVDDVGQSMRPCSHS